MLSMTGSHLRNRIDLKATILESYVTTTTGHLYSYQWTKNSSGKQTFVSFTLVWYFCCFLFLVILHKCSRHGRFFFQRDANKTKSEPAKPITLPSRVTCLPFCAPHPALFTNSSPSPCSVVIQSLGLHWPGSQPRVHPIWELLVFSSDLLEESLRVKGILPALSLATFYLWEKQLHTVPSLQASLPLMISHTSQKQGSALIHRLEATFILQFPRLSVPSNGIRIPKLKPLAQLPLTDHVAVTNIYKQEVFLLTTLQISDCPVSSSEVNDVIQTFPEASPSSQGHLTSVFSNILSRCAHHLLV